MNTEGNDKLLNIESSLGDSEELILQFKSYQQRYTAAIKEVTTKLEILDDEFKSIHEYNPIHNIETRLKSPHSIMKKLEKYNLPRDLDSMSEIKDIAGVRVVCNYIEDIYTIADLLTTQVDITLEKKKDYIKNPKENGYRSLHLIITVPIFLSTGVESIPVEVQIRTIAMDFWASLEHSLRYKDPTDTTKDVIQRLTKCAEVIASVDKEMQDIHKSIHQG
ncbi:putative GTP pyrophosphokinase [Anaerosphaera aminiphila DSM 21120]|uniref:Putative GTP pyrophosphokinase n=1 Tax=Anaerosphaera aminiphila DSM 21120 TaxID=1120995 RepID=A0A1M5PJ75_9FIRM|nr:GTP pyrophosphokinase family protein [Anaerosphaera aminiphila]SHH01834.1 putative GTP pyrophosphokinase [Anaerosphaera aminiphila DSM 21120]